MFPSYVENPTNCRFEGQDPEEQILLLLRAHPTTNLRWIVLAILLFFVPFLVPWMLSFFNLPADLLPESYSLVLVLVNFLLIMTVVFEGFLNWYFNVYIVTNKNVVDIDFHSILYKNIDVAPLRNIEDTSSSMSGILNSVFHYGNVLMQTAGSARNIDFLSVPNPHKVADFVLDNVHRSHGGGHGH